MICFSMYLPSFRLGVCKCVYSLAISKYLYYVKKGKKVLELKNLVDKNYKIVYGTFSSSTWRRHYLTYKNMLHSLCKF